MDYKAAIAALKKLDADEVADLVSAIEGHVGKLEEKSFETIGESRKNSTKARALSEAMQAIGKILGVEGDDLESTLEPKVKELFDSNKTAQSRVSELETRASTAEGKVKSLESDSKLNQISGKIGADPKVLKRLLADKLEEIKVEGESVKLGDKELKEYVEADEDLKAFAPALFPTQQKSEQKPAPKLPSGSPSGNSQKDERPARSYTNSIYGKTADHLIGAGKSDK